MAKAFPDTMDFAGYNAPSRIECDVYDLVVEGDLPTEIEGSWYRSIPDPPYPPLLGDDTYLSGDGMVSLFRFENGHVDFKQRYVQTNRYKAQKQARRGLWGKYRNPYTDDESVRFKVGRGAANTTPVWHGKRLLCLKEDSLGWSVDPHTLETLGEWDYEGELKSQTMTAHPRYDPDTGELHFFGYEADGLASRAVAYCVADKDGNLVKEEWFDAPFCALMHDFAVTKSHVIFPCFPITADLDRLKAGGSHWVFEPDRDSMIGIMPRNGTVRELRWFRFPARSAFHYMNAYSEGDLVHLEFGVSKMVPFGFIREASGLAFDPNAFVGLVRWTFDMSKSGDGLKETVVGPPGDMPRVAEKDLMKDYTIGYYQRYDPQIAPPLVAGPVGAGFNAISRINMKTGAMTTLPMDHRTTVQEHVHIPSKKVGHEGYLAYVADIHDGPCSEVHVLEAEKVENGPIARLKLPLRLRVGVHGNWVSAEAF